MGFEPKFVERDFVLVSSPVAFARDVICNGKWRCYLFCSRRRDESTLIEAPNGLDLQVRILGKFQEGANGVRRWLPEQKENVFVV